MPLNPPDLTGRDVDFVIRDVDNDIKADTISEVTAATGVTIDGVLLKDGILTTAQSIAAGQVKAGVGGLGYTTATNGTVTQITSLVTGVTVSKHTGVITTFAATLVAGADATFTVTNTAVFATDVVLCCTKSYGGTADGIPVCNVVAVAAGSFDINIRNTGAVTLDALITINFMVLHTNFV